MTFNRVAASVFGVLALAHVYRIVQATPIQIGATYVPQWISWVAVLVAGSLSIWGFRSGR